MRVEWVDEAVAYRVGCTFYVHKYFKDRPLLLRELMAHEIEHDDGPFTLRDLTHDLRTGLSWRLRYVILTHPSMWSQALPISRRRGIWHINPTMVLVWTLALTLYMVTLWLV